MGSRSFAGCVKDLLPRSHRRCVRHRRARRWRGVGSHHLHTKRSLCDHGWGGRRSGRRTPLAGFFREATPILLRLGECTGAILGRSRRPVGASQPIGGRREGVQPGRSDRWWPIGAVSRTQGGRDSRRGLARGRTAVRGSNGGQGAWAQHGRTPSDGRTEAIEHEGAVGIDAGSQTHAAAAGGGGAEGNGESSIAERDLLAIGRHVGFHVEAAHAALRQQRKRTARRRGDHTTVA